MTFHDIPAGFKKMRPDNTFTDAVAPLYLKVEGGDMPCIGMIVESKHCNYAGYAHGGSLLTMLDVAMCAIACSALGHYVSAPTVNLSVDFIGSAQKGDWISVSAVSVDLTRTLAFVTAVIEGPKGRVARGSASYKLPAVGQGDPSLSAGDYHEWVTREA